LRAVRTETKNFDHRAVIVVARRGSATNGDANQIVIPASTNRKPMTEHRLVMAMVKSNEVIRVFQLYVEEIHEKDDAAARWVLRDPYLIAARAGGLLSAASSLSA
jgi:hypothetical protein